MSDVVNRSTKEVRYSVNTPEYSQLEWIINPDLSALSGVPTIYWNISGDVITEMTQAEKDTVDAAAQTAQDAANDALYSSYADNAAAIAGGLAVGTLYRTSDLVKVVHS